MELFLKAKKLGKPFCNVRYKGNFLKTGFGSGFKNSHITKLE